MKSLFRPPFALLGVILAHVAACSSSNEPDTTPPTVLSVAPADGSATTERSPWIQIEFSEAMKETTGTIRILPGDVELAASSATWDAGRRTFRIKAPHRFATNETVTVEVRADFSDVAGNTLAAATTYSFTVKDDAGPTVSSATPAEGASNVAVSTSQITVRFSEAMKHGKGTAELLGGSGTLTAPQWDGTSVSWTVSGLKPKTHYALTLDGFENEAGVPLNGTHLLGNGRLDFVTGDELNPQAQAPKVISAIPAEGAAEISLTTSSISIAFSEVMDPTKGEALLLGGSASLGAASWSGNTVTFSLSGLQANTDYTLALDGFVSAAGRALDGVPYLGNNRLDFSTAADVTAPVIVSSSIADGATVSTAFLPESIELRFNEPMQFRAGVAKLVSGQTEHPLSVDWSEDGFALTLKLGFLIEYSSTYVVSLTGFKDRHGNALDLTAWSGALDFTTAEDTFEPVVVHTSPAEGALVTDLVNGRRMSITFNEPMDTDLDITGYPVLEADGEFFGTERRWWSDDGRTLFVEFHETLRANAAYKMHLSEARDRKGNWHNYLAPTPYLVNETLDFSTGADHVAPVVLRSFPADGANLGTDAEFILLTFSEEMDASHGTATLSDGTTQTPLNVSWDEPRIARLDVMGQVPADKALTVTLTGFTDPTGNPLDGSYYLGNGVLDFGSGAPRAISSRPLYGEVDVYPGEGFMKTGGSGPGFGWRLRQFLTLKFNEPMNTSITTAALRNTTAGTVESLTGVWSVDGTEIVYTVEQRDNPVNGLSKSPFAENSQYELDFSALQDTSGVPVDRGTPYYPGGVVRFSTRSKDALLDHACIHLRFGPFKNETASTNFFAPSTGTGHTHYTLTLPSNGAGQFAGYSYIDIIGDDEFGPPVPVRYIVYLRDLVALTAFDELAGHSVPVNVQPAPRACAEYQDGSGNTQPGIRWVATIDAAPWTFVRLFWGPSLSSEARFIVERASSF